MMSVSVKNKFSLRQTAKCIHAGSVIAYPTEAVYGLGCDPLNAQAVTRLLAIKQRPIHKGLILIADNPQQLDPFVEWDPAWRGKVQQSWPGPHTWLLPAKADLPVWINGGKPTVACRVTAHPLAAVLCAAAGSALISTSANRAGRQPAKSALQVRLRCVGVDHIVHGSLGELDKPTCIWDAVTGERIR